MDRIDTLEAVPQFGDDEGRSAVDVVLEQFGIAEPERDAVRRAAIGEFHRRKPDFWRAATTVALLDVIFARAEIHFRRTGVANMDAEDLAGDLRLRILDAFFGRWPRTNAAAWVITLRANLMADHGRTAARHGSVQNSEALASCADPKASPVGFSDLLLDLPDAVRSALDAPRDEGNGERLAASLDMLVELVDELIRDDGGSPRGPAARHARKRTRRGRNGAADR